MEKYVEMKCLLIDEYGYSSFLHNTMFIRAGTFL